MFLPKNDGIDHINTFSKANTELGRLLTNFGHTPFDHPQYGHFESVEAAWYFAKTGFIFPQIKNTFGFQSKKMGRQLMKSKSDNDVETPLSDYFINFIKECISCKLRQNTYILNMLVNTDLPLTHYLYYGDPENNPKVIPLPQYQWQIDHIDDIRKICQEHLRKNNKKGFV